MIYLLVVYAVGLGMMLLGLLWSRELESEESQPIETIIAYVFWPISVSLVALHVVWERFGETQARHARFGAVTRY